jgi:ribosomal protein L28
MAEAFAGQSQGKHRGPCGRGGNLIPCKPGETHNRAGINGATKRRQQLQEIGMKVLGRKVDITVGGRALKASGIEAIWIAMRNEAIKGDVGAATWCRDTAYGKPAQAVELTGADGGPVTSYTVVSYGEAEKC